MKLIVQPQDGIKPLIEGIDKAKKSIEIAIFRFDRREVERALENAVKRGVHVHALIADTNRNGERNLRKLEMRLLSKGVTVARTSDDLVRYHGKVMIIDRKELYVLAFNFTHLDIDRSRSFGIVTKNRQLVDEAIRLFEADTKRQPYTPKSKNFLVSPLNAREQLAAFIKGARKQLLIYDSKVSDRKMVRLLEERSTRGVDVRIVGQVASKSKKGHVAANKMPNMRLHTRTIIRDAHQLFLGSQSLRELELDARREIGVIVHDTKVVNTLVRIFEEDWNATAAPRAEVAKEKGPSAISKVAANAAKAVVEELPPVVPVVRHLVRQATGSSADLVLAGRDVEAAVKDAVKEAVKGVVTDMVEAAADQKRSGTGK